MSPVFIEVWREPRTSGIQLCIGDGNGGYRIAGPKFIGESTLLRRVTIDAMTAAEIRRYLDKVIGE